MKSSVSFGNVLSSLIVEFKYAKFLFFYDIKKKMMAMSRINLVKLAILIITVFGLYQIELWEDLIREKFEFVIYPIIATHFFFLAGGLMMVGIFAVYLVRKIYLNLMMRLPDKLKSHIERSSSTFLLSNYSLDRMWWLVILPFIFGTVIIFVIFPKLGLNIPFKYLYYSLPILGVVYLVIDDIMEEWLSIKLETKNEVR